MRILFTSIQQPFEKQAAMQLLSQGHEIKALAAKELPPGVIAVRASLFDILSLTEVCADVDVVVHSRFLADFSESNKEALWNHNNRATAFLVDALLAGGKKKIVFWGTHLSMGFPVKAKTINPQTKWHHPKEAPEFALTMHMAERQIWRGMMEGLSVVVFNAGILQSKTIDHHGPARWIQEAAQRLGNLHLKGSSLFLHEEAACKALLWAIEHKEPIGKRILLGTANRYYRDVFTAKSKQSQPASTSYFQRLLWSQRVKNLLSTNKNHFWSKSLIWWLNRQQSYTFQTFGQLAQHTPLSSELQP